MHGNAPPHDLQAQFGHRSPDFTQPVYGHLLARDRGRYADRLDDGAAFVADARDVPG